MWTSERKGKRGGERNHLQMQREEEGAARKDSCLGADREQVWLPASSLGVGDQGSLWNDNVMSQSIPVLVPLNHKTSLPVLWTVSRNQDSITLHDKDLVACSIVTRWFNTGNLAEDCLVCNSSQRTWIQSCLSTLRVCEIIADKSFNCWRSWSPLLWDGNNPTFCGLEDQVGCNLWPSALGSPCKGLPSAGGGGGSERATWWWWWGRGGAAEVSAGSRCIRKRSFKPHGATTWQENSSALNSTFWTSYFSLFA